MLLFELIIIDVVVVVAFAVAVAVVVVVVEVQQVVQYNDYDGEDQKVKQ